MNAKRKATARREQHIKSHEKNIAKTAEGYSLAKSKNIPSNSVCHNNKYNDDDTWYGRCKDKNAAPDSLSTPVVSSDNSLQIQEKCENAIMEADE